MPDGDFLTAAVLNGAPVNTLDLDIVSARDEENVARLVRVLDLATIVALKEELADQKDRAVLPIPRRTLARKDR